MGGVPAVSGSTLIIGVGNRYRNDDRAGLEVAERLALRSPVGARILTTTGDGAELLDLWQAAATAILIDAQRSGCSPGSICRYLAAEILSGNDFPLLSSHGFGVIDAVRLGAALGRLPRHLIIYGIEGQNFDSGTELSPEVDAAVDRVIDLILEELACMSIP